MEPHPSQRPDTDLTGSEALDWGGGVCLEAEEGDKEYGRAESSR